MLRQTSHVLDVCPRDVVQENMKRSVRYSVIMVLQTVSCGSETERGPGKEYLTQPHATCQTPQSHSESASYWTLANLPAIDFVVEIAVRTMHEGHDYILIGLRHFTYGDWKLGFDFPNPFNLLTEGRMLSTPPPKHNSQPLNLHTQVPN